MHPSEESGRSLILVNPRPIECRVVGCGAEAVGLSHARNRSCFSTDTGDVNDSVPNLSAERGALDVKLKELERAKKIYAGNQAALAMIQG